MTILLFSCINNENKWKNESELIGNWINIERDDKGYLIYDPCDGNTNFIDISKEYVIYDLGHEGPDTLKIEKVDILTSTDKIEFIATNEFYSIKSILKKIDSKEKLFLLKWKLTPVIDKGNERNGKMMMTRMKFEKDFRFIDNPCDSGKIPEKKFLPIEYD